MIALRALFAKVIIPITHQQTMRVVSRGPMMLASQQTRAFSAFSNHRNTEDNNEDTPFEFTKENYEKIQELLNQYPSNYKESACIPVLFIAQK